MDAVLGGGTLAASAVLAWVALRGPDGAATNGIFALWHRFGWLPLLLVAGCAVAGVVRGVPALVIPQVLLYAGFSIYLAPLVLRGSSGDCRCSRVPTRPGWAGLGRALFGSLVSVASISPLAGLGGTTPSDLVTLVVLTVAIAALMMVVPPAVDGPPRSEVLA